MAHRISRRVATTVLLLALAGAAFFAVRTARQFFYWSDPAHHRQAPEAWMTLGYLERSYKLPPHSLGQEIGIAPGPDKHRSLEEIAEDEGLSLSELMGRVETALGESN